MVREWGMSERVGPMAWGPQGAVFLGEDLMHGRDYSEETARVIDEEVERILREQEDRCRHLLRQHRAGLDAVAAALLANETIDGAEVRRLVAAASNGSSPPAGTSPDSDPATESLAPEPAPEPA
jgi:cell division protease FtsH